MSRPSLRLSELAERLGLERRGESDPELHGVGTLENAGPGELSFLANARYRRHLPATRAGAVIVAADAAAAAGAVPVLVAEDPYLAYARAAALFAPPAMTRAGRHPSAVVDPAAEVHESAWVGPQAVVEAGARIAPGVFVGPGSIVGEDAAVGEGSLLHGRVTLCRGVRLGRRVIVHPGAVIGADGFGLAFDRDHWVKVPQLGSVQVGDDCEIGANTTIDRGALEDTVLEEDVRLDNLVQVAHNVRIGAHTAMAGCAAVAGSARIGRYCLIAGGAGILGHLEVADRVTVTAMSLVTRSIREPGEYSSGTPLQPNRDWRRNAVRMRQLDAMARSINALKKDR